MAWELAQINVGIGRFANDDDRMLGFMSQLDDINTLAESTPGFVWRLQDESGNATGIDVGGPDRFMINMSVWTSLEALSEFVYRSNHRDVMIRRREWFQRPAEAYQALWWIPAGHRPTPAEGIERLETLRKEGPTEQAFSFAHKYPAPGSTSTDADDSPAPSCSGWD